MNALHLIILALATWRLSSFLTAEEGPYNILSKLRAKVGVRYSGEIVVAHGELAKLFSCTWCLSVWIGAIASVAYYYLREPIVWIALPLALSAAAIIVGKFVES